MVESVERSILRVAEVDCEVSLTRYLVEPARLLQRRPDGLLELRSARGEREIEGLPLAGEVGAQLVRGFSKRGGVTRPIRLRLGAGEVDFYDGGFVAGDEDGADRGVDVRVNHCR